MFNKHTIIWKKIINSCHWPYTNNKWFRRLMGVFNFITSLLTKILWPWKDSSSFSFYCSYFLCGISMFGIGRSFSFTKKITAKKNEWGRIRLLKKDMQQDMSQNRQKMLSSIYFWVDRKERLSFVFSSILIPWKIILLTLRSKSIIGIQQLFFISI